MQTGEIVDDFPFVDIDSPACDAVRLLAEHRLTGLVVGSDISDKPYAVLPASQVVRFLVPAYVQDDPGLARVLTESTADHAADKLNGKTIRVLPRKVEQIPAVDADDTIIEVAATVVKVGKLQGVITASRLLAEVLRQRPGI